MSTEEKFSRELEEALNDEYGYELLDKDDDEIVWSLRGETQKTEVIYNKSHATVSIDTRSLNDNEIINFIEIDTEESGALQKVRAKL